MSRLSKDNVGKGAAYLYIENISGLVSAYVFWLVVAKITAPEVIGVSGTIVSVAGIISTIVNLGIPISIERFLGKALGSQTTTNIRKYVMASLLLLGISLVVCGLVTIIAEMLISDILLVFNSNFPLLVLTLILISSTSISRLFRGIIIATIETRILAIAILFSTAAKFVITLVLLSFGLKEVGLTTGIVSFTVAQSVLLGPVIIRILNKGSSGMLPDISLLRSATDLLKGGIPNWVPNLITALGAQLGTILIYGSNGANQAGFYFVGLSIYSGIQTGMSVLFSITYPVLSSLNEGKEKLTNRTIKMSLVSSVPLSYSMIFYADKIMNIFGHAYVDAALALQILLLSILPVAITTGITNHVYASGHYRHTMIIGIASSLPRVILYLMLVPFLGSTGAAISFTVGSIVGLVTSLLVAVNTKVTVNRKDTLLISIIPLSLSYTLSFSEINFAISILLSLAITYLLLIKVNIISHNDIHDSLLILPKRVANPILKVIDPIGRKLHKSY